MAKIEPGSFKASDDVRVFDDIDDGDSDEEGSRLPLLIVIAMLVLAAFGGVVWLAYNQGVQKGRADSPRPLIAETQTPGQNRAIKVYEQPAAPDSDTSEEDSAPPPPTTVKPAPTPMAQTQTPPPTTMAQAAPKPVVTAAPAETAPVPAPKPQPLAEATPKPVPVKAKPVTPQDTPVATAPPKSAAASGDYVLQIGAYKSQDEADAAWKSYQRKHAMLSGYASDVKQADLGEKGTWYRLRVGAFSKDSASALCTKLKADGGDCLLAKK